MPRFCPNCGEEISEKTKFCSSCGANIGSFSLKPNHIPQEIKPTNEKKIEEEKKEQGKKTDFGKILVLIIGCILLFSVIFSNMPAILSAIRTSQTQYTTQPQIPSVVNYIVPTPTESQTDRNIRIANEIVATYHQSHVYSLTDLYVCADMASDVWDMLKAQGINAKINVGNVDKDISSIQDANHAWVMAEVSPNGYLALETTGGYSVQQADNPRYYFGWSFYNPKQLKQFTQLMQEQNDAITKYNTALNDYNNFVQQYNNANVFTKIAWKSQLDDKQLILSQRTQDLNQITQQINSLLSSL